MNFFFARKQLGLCESELKPNRSDARSQLFAAFEKHLSRLDERDLPLSLKYEFRDITQFLQARNPSLRDMCDERVLCTIERIRHLCRELESIAITRQVPVLNYDVPVTALAGHSGLRNLKKCVVAGMSDYLSNSIDPEILSKKAAECSDSPNT